jgi:hypothetical protein
MKIRLVGAELFHADGRTDRHDEAGSIFSQFYYSAYNKAAQCREKWTAFY